MKSSRRCWRWVLVIALHLLSSLSDASPQAKDGRLLLTSAAALSTPPVVAFLEDREGLLTLEQAASAGLAELYRPWHASAGDLNLGFTSSVYWLRVRIQRSADADARWLLQIPYLSLDDIEFHAPGKQPVLTGSRHPVSSRPFLDRFFVFPIELGTAPSDFYIRVKSRYALTVPIRVFAPSALAAHAMHTHVLHSLYQGGVLALALYNLLIFLSLGDRRFLMYALFAASFGLAIFAGNGYAGLLLWPHATDFNTISQSFWLSLAAALALMFSREFLFAQTRTALWTRGMNALAIIMFGNAAVLAASMWAPSVQQASNLILVLGAPAAGALILASAVRDLRKHRRRTRLFLLAWGTLWMGGFVATARALGWLPTNVVTTHALQLASSVEMLLLALALADTIRIERETREQAQNTALQAQAEAVKVLSSSEERLESAVKERTEQLQRALDKEQQALASHMRLAALISHEFRNPLAVMDAQITLIRREQTLGLLDLQKRLAAIAGAERRLRTLLERWVQNDRLRTSIEAIDPRPVPLDAWLHEFVGAHPEFAAHHAIELQCDDGLPDVSADEHLLEIALGNLVANACAYSGNGSTVTIRALREEHRVGLAVIDRGIGIQTEHLDKVFEPYFRAHPDDQIHGMGLGLNFVRRIAEAHGWRIELRSQPGEGSEFQIWMAAPHVPSTAQDRT